MKIIEIEPTNHCNLRCVMCHNSFVNYKPSLFNIEWLKRINSENSIIKISSIFEPLIHPEIDKIIEYFAENNNKIILTTNLTLLSPNLLKILKKFEENIYSITVSIDSTKAEIYNSIRRGADFNITIKNRKLLRNFLSETYNRVNSVLMKKNYNFIIDDIEFFNKIGINELGLIFITIRDYLMFNENLYDIKNNLFKKLNEAIEYVIENNLNISVRCPYFKYSPIPNIYTQEMSKDVPDYIPKGINCSAIEKQVKIFADGIVQLCYQ